MIVRFRLRRDTAANWASVNPILGLGEPGLETDTRKVKYGDGATAWNSLAYSTVSLSAILDAITALGSVGLIARTGAGTVAPRTILGTASEITVANGSGAAGDPTISLPAAITATGKTVTGGTFSGITLSGATTLPGSGTVTSSGLLGIGGTPADKVHVYGAKGATTTPSAPGVIISDTTAMAPNVGGGIVFRFKYHSDGSETTGASCGAAKTNGTSGDFGCDFVINTRVNGGGNTEKVRVGTIGHVVPGADNVQNVGSGALRWKEIFCGNNVINTSDATLKVVISRQLDQAEAAWADAIELVAFQFKDAIAEKGPDGARINYGVLAQEVYAAGIAAGIPDPFRYAFLCRDALMTREARTRPVERVATRRVRRKHDEIEIRDGVPALVSRRIYMEVPVVDFVPVVGTDGSPITGADVPLYDKRGRPRLCRDGSPITGEGPVCFPVPRLVIATESYEEIVPLLNAEGEPVMRWGIRYDQLQTFLYERLRARIAALEAKG